MGSELDTREEGPEESGATNQLVMTTQEKATVYIV